MGRYALQEVWVGQEARRSARSQGVNFAVGVRLAGRRCPAISAKGGGRSAAARSSQWCIGVILKEYVDSSPAAHAPIPSWGSRVTHGALEEVSEVIVEPRGVLGKLRRRSALRGRLRPHDRVVVGGGFDVELARVHGRHMLRPCRAAMARNSDGARRGRKCWVGRRIPISPARRRGYSQAFLART